MGALTTFVAVIILSVFAGVLSIGFFSKVLPIVGSTFKFLVAVKAFNPSDSKTITRMVDRLWVLGIRVKDFSSVQKMLVYLSTISLIIAFFTTSVKLPFWYTALHAGVVYLICKFDNFLSIVVHQEDLMSNRKVTLQMLRQTGYIFSTYTAVMVMVYLQIYYRVSH